MFQGQYHLVIIYFLNGLVTYLFMVFMSKYKSDCIIIQLVIVLNVEHECPNDLKEIHYFSFCVVITMPNVFLCLQI